MWNKSLYHSMKYWLVCRDSPFLDYYYPQYMKGSIIPELIINQPSFTVSVISTYIPIYPYNFLYIPIYLMISLYIIIISPAKGLAATAQLDHRRPKHRSIAFLPTDHRMWFPWQLWWSKLLHGCFNLELPFVKYWDTATQNVAMMYPKSSNI